MNKLDLTTIILVYNEEIHIRRCLENVCPFSKKVIVVDSPSTDRTVEICKEFDNVEVVVHMLKISCGSSVVSSYYTTFLLVKKPGIKFQNRNLQFVFLMGFFPLM